MPQQASRMQLVRPSAIRELLALAADPDVISFGGGYPDPDLFPARELAAAYARALGEQAAVSLQYTHSEGLPRLREQLAERMRADGMECGPEHLFLVQGAQQAIDLVGKMWLEPGDVVLTEEPTFLGGLVGLNPYEPEYRAVRTDDHGMDPDHLEEVLRANPRAKLIYTIPDFHNPTGVTMTTERRRRVVELAREHDVVILEDAPYRELYFGAAPLPTLKSFDTDGRVFHVGSFSKTLAPGLRTAWVVADAELIERLALLKLASDTQNSTLNMAAISNYLEEQDYDAHLDRIRDHYRGKRDHTVAALRAELSDDIRYVTPQGGLFLWLEFPEDVDTDRFLREVLIPEYRVAFVPGSSFYSENPRYSRGRLGFPTLPVDRISQGIRRIAEGYNAFRSV
ncbi:PLP-dependent aminotransferase family protein [Leucobacter sp. CSA2]|uniref:PLP-dependent aminotransferase family protein n=1 Tax=Leucobacter edaphi TaxID=2796472 RepID=A0A934QDS7_9MICO|nr:PLP-dependent aminotransferase family protein [Leucobacter edaphi]MBK0421930.1 PLP-dependent aminotransferase family protein [Leucobacter edaphi]